VLDVEALIILFDLGKRQHLILLVAWQVFDRGRRRDEFNCVRLSDDFTDILGLEILLADVARLIVEKAMRVTHPCHTSKENHCFFLWQALVDSEGVAVGVETAQASSSPAYAQRVTSLSIGSDSVATFLVRGCRSKSVGRRRAHLGVSSK
jgi:hypothetical protein